MPGRITSKLSDLDTRCVIAGCGPAGAVVGFLLARAGVDVIVLEKHGDFLRDFRGDTIHPSTLEILDELGLADRFLQLPHSRISNVRLRSTSGDTIAFSLERLHTPFRYIAFVPQWDFLSFMTAEAKKFPSFHLEMNAEATDLIEEDGVVRGVRVGNREIRAPLTIGADGRASRTREAAALPSHETSPPMDVFWFRVSRHPDEEEALAGRLGRGAAIVMIDRREYWQIAYLIRKGSADTIRAAGIDAFRKSVEAIEPRLSDRVKEIRSFDDVKLLSVRSDRLLRWYKPGYLAIGDAAHAMSPIGGVGINVAIHDAVEAANVLWRPLADGHVDVGDLRRVQKRRQRSVRAIQAIQTFIQNRLIGKALKSEAFDFPRIVHLIARTPLVRDLPPHMVAFGIGRPHVRTPDHSR